MMQDAYVANVKLLRESRLEKRADFHEPRTISRFSSPTWRCLPNVRPSPWTGGLQDVAEDDAVKQRAFLDEHVLQLDRSLRDRRGGGCGGGLYVHLARFTEEFVKWDAELLLRHARRIVRRRVFGGG